jgi:hypothetical protein
MKRMGRCDCLGISWDYFQCCRLILSFLLWSKNEFVFRSSWRLLIMRQKRHRQVCGGSMRVHEPAFTLMKNSVLSRLRSGSWTSYARVMLSFERKIAEILKIAGWEKSFLCFCSGDVDAFKLVLIEFLQDIAVTGVRMGELSGFRNGEIRQEMHRQNWSLSVSY